MSSKNNKKKPSRNDEREQLTNDDGLMDMGMECGLMYASMWIGGILVLILLVLLIIWLVKKTRE